MKKRSNKLDDILTSLKHEDFCYLITIGRVTGNPHEIEIWFGLNNTTLYLMSGDGKSDWVKRSGLSGALSRNMR